MTYINSNLTNREAYAQYGKLDEERMQELIRDLPTVLRIYEHIDDRQLLKNLGLLII